MGSGFIAKAGGAVSGKAAALVATGALVVTGAAGAGVWWAVRGPQLAVVQRSTSVEVPAGGEQATVAGCEKHETALGGGYAVDGGGFATSSEFVGGAWLAAAYNPGGTPARLTAYALCINAAPRFAPRGDFTWRAHAFKDRANKVTAADGGLIHDLSTDGAFAGAPRTADAVPACQGGYTMVGTEFRAERLVAGQRVAPVPLDALGPTPAAAGSGPWLASVNPGTELTSRSWLLKTSDTAERRTRIEDPQPPQANYAVGLRPICVQLKNVSLATAEIAVGAGGSAEAAVGCPKGRLVVGGGFRFTADDDRGTSGLQRFLGDGWLYASADAPTPGASGRPVKDWHVTGENGQQAGTEYHDSVWIEHSDRETLTGNGYFDSHQHGPDDQLLRGATVPDSRRMVAGAVCATVDAEPTSPDKGAAPTTVTRPTLPPALDLTPTAASPVVPSASGPAASTAPPATDPAGSPSASPAPRTPTTPVPATGSPGRPSSTPPSGTQSPQAPAVSIQQPASGGTIRRGCEETFTGTAVTRPGNRPITDPQAVTWQIIGPNGPVPIGAGASGRFTVPLLADGTYQLVLTATDTASGLTGRAQIPVRIAGCLR
ncbi:hypothetical protein [Kitasatospora sp. NPDC059571]|uniref:hypothetical protein n=1 Tax=Kitasatospora sp. NPDC059571 TaxID=3346871 RepID=UPI0036AB87D0